MHLLVRQPEEARGAKTDVQLVADATVSNTGDRIVYVVERGGGSGTWVLSRGDGSQRRIQGIPPRARSLAWSRDDRRIAFTTPDEHGSKIVVASADGSQIHELTAGVQYYEPTFSPDGWIYASRNNGGDYDIWVVDPRDGGAQPVIVSPGYDGQPSVSRDGRHLLFVSRRSGLGSVWASEISGEKPRRITKDNVETRSPLWLGPASVASAESDREDSKTKEAEDPRGYASDCLLMLRPNGDGWSVWKMWLKTGKLVELINPGVSVSRVSVSGDGSRVLVNGMDGSLKLYDADGTFIEDVLYETERATDAFLSPDGRSIVYAAMTMGLPDTDDLWVIDLDLQESWKIVTQARMQHQPFWSSDDYVYYVSKGERDGLRDLWRVPAPLGEPELLVTEHGRNLVPTKSDTGVLAFTSDVSGEWEVWLRDDQTGESRQVTSGDGYVDQPAISADGRHLIYVRAIDSRNQIILRELASGEETVVDQEHPVRNPIWLQDCE